mmetsp:Transcript_20754/g.41301  ORF Transcript_20754/g.41301 Transcript_20754/m.41301 type:complete len:130 (-) Transcript_20754:72-461(-)
MSNVTTKSYTPRRHVLKCRMQDDAAPIRASKYYAIHPANHTNKTTKYRTKITITMQHTDSTLLRLETLALFFFSLAFGAGLLRIKEYLFGDVGDNHHIDFKKKREAEEQANLDEMFRVQGSNLDTDVST